MILLFLAGIAAGLSGSIAGLASIFSYPALLYAGLSPVEANKTNAISLVSYTLGSVTGSFTELGSQIRLLRRLILPALAGGVLGSALLLLTPPSTFERLVPLLILAASLVMLLPRDRGAGRGEARGPGLVLGVFGIAIYGGYFGAAAGVLMMAFLLQTTVLELPEANAMKNVLLGVANGVAAVIYVFSGHIGWSAAVPLAAGLFAGGRSGPALVRKLHPGILRIVIGLSGAVVATMLWSRGR